MFTEWMISSTPKKEKGKTGLTGIVSIIFHALIIAAMIIIPILSSSKLPKYEVNAAFLAPPPPPPPPPPPRGGKKINKKLEEKLKQLKKKKAEAKKTQQLVAPLDIPKEEPQDTDAGLIEGLQDIGEGVEGGVEGGIEGGVEEGSLSGLLTQVGGENLERVQTVVQPPKIIKKVAPIYPPLAAKIRAQGDVVLQCVTDIYGNVVNVKVLSSPHPLLTKAAIDAVRQWKFEPMIINGIPRPVRFVLTVKFRLR